MVIARCHKYGQGSQWTQRNFLLTSDPSNSQQTVFDGKRADSHGTDTSRLHSRRVAEIQDLQHHSRYLSSTAAFKAMAAIQLSLRKSCRHKRGLHFSEGRSLRPKEPFTQQRRMMILVMKAPNAIPGGLPPSTFHSSCCSV